MAATDIIEDTKFENAPQKEAAAEGKQFVSKGWRFHNELTYRVVDWLLNSTVGVATAYWIQKKPTGQYISGHLNKKFEWVLSNIFRVKDVAKLEEGAKWGTRFASIMAGGFAIIPLMMVLENKKIKRKIVRWFDEKIYGKESVKNDPKFEESYQRIDREPEKGFWAGFAARILSLAPLLYITFTPDIHKHIDKYFYQGIIGRSTKGAAEAIGIKPAGMIGEKNGDWVHPNGDPSKPKVWQTNWEFLHQLIGFDFGLTIFYSFMHEIAYKTLAAFGIKEEKAPKNAASSPSTSAPDPAVLTPKTVEKTISHALRREKAENFVSAVDASRKSLEPRSMTPA